MNESSSFGNAWSDTGAVKLSGKLNELMLIMDRARLTLGDMKKLRQAARNNKPANDGDSADFKDRGHSLWSARVADNTMRTGIPRQRKEN